MKYPIISKITTNGKEHNVHIVPLEHIHISVECKEPSQKLIDHVKKGIHDPIFLERKDGKLEVSTFDITIVKAAKKAGIKSIKAVIKENS